MRKRKTLAEILDRLTKDLYEAATGELDDALSNLLQNFGVSPAVPGPDDAQPLGS